MVPHRGVVSYLAWVVREYGLSPSDVVLQRSTLSFDASVRDLLGPLTAGARVALVHTHEAADPVALLRRIRDHRVNAILAIVPSLLRPFLDAAEEVASPPSLRLLLVSGEPLAVADCRRARRAFGSGLRMVNQWGVTECTVTSSFHTVEEEDGAGGAPVGVPIASTGIHVLDPQMQPVPRGVAGEAYIAGVGLTRGYQNQPGLTAERFLPDPFGAAPGARIYRVGDRVRRRADGSLEFLGRLDHQVKVRGIRVETREVEAVLRARPGVREAVVVAREAAPGETRLVAYVAGEEEALADGALHSSLERTLPAHMIPSVFVRLEELPLLPNGKVNRAALPAPVPGGSRDGQGYVAPSTATERILAEIWEQLLDVRPVGVDDHFFRLGGHSMLAVGLMARIRRRLGAEVPLSALFEHPTVRGLAARIEGEPRPRPWSPLVAIQPHGDRVPIFFVHPVGGEVLCYADLARELGPEQPFYGLQAGDLVHLGEEEARIEDMAARYVAAIREVRPNGPYLLGGWSFGGFVAFEMGQQLARAGESVPLVTMLDTRAPGQVRPADLDPCIRLAGMARAEAHAAGKEISLTADDLRTLDPEARIARTLDVLKGAGVVPNDVEAGWLRGMEVRMRAARRYEPRPYHGRVAMFVASERYASPEFRPLRDGDSPPGWEAYVSEPLLKQKVAGDHNTMVRGENAATLARHLRAVIEESLLTAQV
jgi:thioesterase domain-containing protein/acyl carrier protein